MDCNYHFYQKINICPQCKNVALFGQEKLCPECRAYFANRMSRQREINNDRLKQLKNESYRRIADYRNKNNLCTKCGKPRTDEYKMCPNCRAKNTRICRQKRNTKENKTEYRLKNGLCRFCDNERMDGYSVCEKHHKHLTEISRSEKQLQNRKNLIDNKILF